MGGLYRWQVEAVEAWLGRREGVIVAPTGAGKTRVAVEAIRRVGERPVLFIVPTNVLVRQHYRVLRGCGLSAGVWNGMVKGVGRDVTLTTYSSAYLHVNYLCRVHDMIVFDEVHHAFAERWVRILEAFKAMGKRSWMGLTATPEGVPEHYIVYRLDHARAMREGCISQADVHVITVDIPAERRREYSYIMGQIERLRMLLGRIEGEEERMEVLRRLAIWNNRLRMLLDVTVEKEMVICEIVRLRGIDRALIFVESIEHAEALARALRARGLRALAYHSRMGRDDRERVLEAWRASGGLLIAVRALDEGIDVPACKHIFILSCPKRFRRAVQRIGRGLRPGDRLQVYIVETVGQESGAAKAVALELARLSGGAGR